MPPENEFEQGKELGQQLGQIVGELKSLNDKFAGLSSSLHDFKSGIGGRVQSAEITIGVLKDNRDDFKKHIDNHWRWVTGAVGVLTIVAIIINFISKAR